MSTPPAALSPDTFADRLYDALAPLAGQDDENDWSLLVYCNAIGTLFQQVEDWVRDTPGGPGWSLLLDLGRCPPEALGWLGQFVGARIPAGLDDADQRAWIASTDGFKRGTRDALIGAARATLTGAQTVLFVERSGDPAVKPDYAYFLNVSTYVDQTPNPTATLNALLAQKPGGIVLDYRTVAGQTYGQVHANYASYTALNAAYPSYDAVRSDEPA